VTDNDSAVTATGAVPLGLTWNRTCDDRPATDRLTCLHSHLLRCWFT